MVTKLSDKRWMVPTGADPSDQAAAGASHTPVAPAGAASDTGFVRDAASAPVGGSGDRSGRERRFDDAAVRARNGLEQRPVLPDIRSARTVVLRLHREHRGFQQRAEYLRALFVQHIMRAGVVEIARAHADGAHGGRFCDARNASPHTRFCAMCTGFSGRRRTFRPRPCILPGCGL